MTIRQLAYTSIAKPGFAWGDLNAILNTARNENQNREITGLLLFGENVFMQITEGPPENIERLFANIVRDTRHKDVVCLYDGARNDRYYGACNMKFFNFGSYRDFQFNEILWMLKRNAPEKDLQLVFKFLKAFESKLHESSGVAEMRSATGGARAVSL